ncbi:MAG: hypothetical protein AABY75_06990 [Bacteroidota bacterium]
MSRRTTDIVSGILLASIGVLLSIRAAGVAPETMATVAWSLASILAGIHAFSGLVAGNTGRKFWGAFGCVAAAHSAVWSSGLMVPALEETIASGFLWVGLAFAFLWLSAPYKLDLLAPAIVFCGPGVGYYLWWYDVVRLESLERWAGDGWPFLLVLLGAGVLLRSLIPSRQ